MKVVGFHNQCPVVEFQYRYVCSSTGIALRGHSDNTPPSIFCQTGSDVERSRGEGL